MKFILSLSLILYSSAWAQKGGSTVQMLPPLPQPSASPSPSAPAPAAMVAAPTTTISTNIPKIKPSFWMRHCKAKFSKDISFIQDANNQKRLILANAKSAADRVQIRASTILLDIFHKVAKAPMEMVELQKYPESITVDGGDPRIANIYNEFVAASKNFQQGFRSDPRDGGVTNDACSASRVRSARSEHGQFTYQIATTKRFLLARYMLSKYASEALAALEKPPIQSPEENKQVAALIKIAMTVALEDIQACPLNVWQASKERFLQFKGDPTQVCSAPELVAFMGSAGPKFDPLIQSLKISGSSDSDPRQRRPRNQLLVPVEIERNVPEPAAGTTEGAPAD